MCPPAGHRSGRLSHAPHGRHRWLARWRAERRRARCQAGPSVGCATRTGTETRGPASSYRDFVIQERRPALRLAIYQHLALSSSLTPRALTSCGPACRRQVVEDHPAFPGILVPTLRHGPRHSARRRGRTALVCLRQAHDDIRRRVRKHHTAPGLVAGSLRLAEVCLAAAAGQRGLEGGKLLRKVWASWSRRTRRWSACRWRARGGGSMPVAYERWEQAQAGLAHGGQRARCQRSGMEAPGQSLPREARRTTPRWTPLADPGGSHRITTLRGDAAPCGSPGGASPLRPARPA